jgi:hypothetical protein
MASKRVWSPPRLPLCALKEFPLAAELEDSFPLAFMKRKTNLATQLSAGACGGDYGDAIVILSSAVSSLAALLYPRPTGGRIDRKRFVQVWARYADPDLRPTHISVPVLAQECHAEGDEDTVRALRKLRPDVLRWFPEEPDGLVINGSEADASESEILALCPGLPLVTLRECSYPALFYTHIRSGYVHEGDVGKFGSGRHGGRNRSEISYSNVMKWPFRRIHFDVRWLCQLAESIARGASGDLYQERPPLPKVWWLGGGPA